jgi:diguanylate cyclase (GGDEF)-like protein
MHLKKKKAILKPIEWAIWVLIIALSVFVFQLTLPVSGKMTYYFFLLTIILYISFLFYWIIPHSANTPWLYYGYLAVSVFLIGWAQVLFAPYHLDFSPFLLLLITFAGFTGQWTCSVLILTLSSLATYYLYVNSYLPPGKGSFLSIAFTIFLYITFGSTSTVLGRTLQRAFNDTARQNRELALLVESNRIISQSEPIQNLLPDLAEIIASGLPVSMCRVLLLDESNQILRGSGLYAHRAFPGTNTNPGASFSLEHLPFHQRAIQKNKSGVAKSAELKRLLSSKEERSVFFPEAHSVCVIPIYANKVTWGTITLSEQRHWAREPFTPQKLELLSSLGRQIALTLQNEISTRNLEKQFERLAVLTEVSQAINQTIEIDDLLELIYHQISRILPSDTYFVALYLPDTNQNDIRFLIDDGRKYPQQQTPADQGLASWVLRHKRPLLIRHLEEDIQKLDIDPLVIGEEKMSQSWLGVPLIAINKYIGLLAVASYSPRVYDQEDKMLLQQIAGQAALVINNARQHALVKEQARRDSLTGVYNHGYLIQSIHKEVDRARHKGNDVSMIMLDIDYFKQYNDTYGHVTGDRVLTITVQAIRSHVKQTDTVGRWGGEEFGIVLPNANLEQARQVAHRIRETLQSLVLKDNTGTPIPKPTISQGIATYPLHTQDSNELINMADKALFKAKNKGRDQIAVYDPSSSNLQQQNSRFPHI